MPKSNPSTVMQTAPVRQTSVPHQAVTAPRVTTAQAVRRPDTRRPWHQHVARVVADLELHVPRDCCATVLLKLVAHDAQYRYYAQWVSVGRHDLDTVSVAYKFTGEDTIRIDVPEGVSLCSSWISSCLIDFLAEEGLKPDPPPIVGPPPPPKENQ